MMQLFRRKGDSNAEESPKERKSDQPARTKKPVKLPGFLQKPLFLIFSGAVLITVAAGMLFVGSAGEQQSDQALAQGQRAVGQMREAVTAFTGLFEDEQVLELAGLAMENPERTAELEQYLAGRVSEFVGLSIIDPEQVLAFADSPTDHHFIIMAMALEALESGQSDVQSFEVNGQRVVAGAVTIPRGGDPEAVLLIKADIGLVLGGFNMTIPQAGYIGLEQRNGRFSATALQSFGDPSQRGVSPYRLNVPGTLFRVVLPMGQQASGMPSSVSLALFVLGGLLLAFGGIRRVQLARTLRELEEDPAMLEEVAEDMAPQAEEEATEALGPSQLESGAELLEESVAESEPKLKPEPDLMPGVNLEDVRFDPDKHRKERRPQPETEVSMRKDIFRAYDIRGIVGETLDRGIAYRVGQAIGSAALEANAAPVVVGRDGRHSGPDLAEGMVEGISSAGCDVVDIGAVPTGVLYYMANECDSGSGVMVTGSHNPPDYNGFKVMIGGETLAGDKIRALFERLESGDLKTGEGIVNRTSALDRYRDRIASDIQLERPLKVVADCGNGIGGVNAADVLRAIGAEVLPLYDEVNGDFPNHHPDPSEPENLRDLIESVRLMDADLGVAFDGDADRLGVVTPSGEIIYSDRVMMLFATEILSRHPGAPIIYDVKCTGHLDQVIREAGGEPEMYKTGHSLIKNHMRKAGAPFAGEMSGHFFFSDRWYGFDCGIYSAARLLEILAKDERSPEEVLTALPNSVSTPELKVHMTEGANHAFIRKFQDQANFPDARVNTIDGIRADFEDGWGLCRASNTTPILVVRFDAESEEALQVIQEAFRMQMLAIEPDLELPF